MHNEGVRPLEAPDRIIVALDTNQSVKALLIVKELGPHVGLFKIGLQLLMAMLADTLSPNYPYEQARGNLDSHRTLMSEVFRRLFLDGKFDDIPNTVAGAAKELLPLGVRMFNVHASAGMDSVMAAAENKGDALLLAVSVLTSFDEENGHLTFGEPTKAKVLQFAREAKLAGCDGIICSPKELEILGKRKELKGLLKVTPGVRPEWASSNDQKRVMTPGEAIKAGADYLVIGRPITDPPKEIGGPVEAAKMIAQEIEEGLKARKE